MDVNLILFKNNGEHKTFPLPDDITVIGRRNDCDLRIPLSHVSRRHCQINRNKDTLKIRDLGSRNGTYINEKRVDDESTVKPGDYVRIGPLTFLLQINGQPEKIVPPPQSKQKPARKEKSEDKKAPDQGSSEALELDLDMESDESDSFLAELEDL